MVGENIVFKDCNGIETKMAILIAAPYCPIATLDIAKIVSKTVSTASSTVSTIEVKKFGVAKPIHSRRSYSLSFCRLTLVSLRKKTYKLTSVQNMILSNNAIETEMMLRKKRRTGN